MVPSIWQMHQGATKAIIVKDDSWTVGGLVVIATIIISMINTFIVTNAY